MRYKNTKTGAIINSSCTINGGDWIKFDDFPKEEVVEATVEETEEYIEEDVDLEEMTNKELEKFAKEHKIELSTDDKKNKKSLIAAIVKAFE